MSDPATVEPSPYPWGQGRKPRADDELELTIDAIDARGLPSARVDGFVMRVRHAPLGSRVHVRVRRRRGQRVDADVVRVLDPGPAAAQPRCGHFGNCGGCRFQDWSYQAQLDALGARLKATFAPLQHAIELGPILPAKSLWHYRNKMDFTFSNRRWIQPDEPEDAERDFALGLFPPGWHEKVLDIEHCDICFEEANPILSSARELAREAGLTLRDQREHVGLLRHLILRKAFATGEILVGLVTSSEDPDGARSLAARLIERHPEITTFVHVVTDRVSCVAIGEEQTVLHGPGVIVERLEGLEFEVSAGSFFQTNTEQAELLGRTVRELAAPRPTDRVLDVYCGGGALSLGLASSVERVFGIELVEQAIDDARRNAARNRIENAEFVVGDAAALLEADALGGLGIDAPDLVVVDPPRAGLHPRALAGLRQLAAPRIVMVSCNPVTAVRDLGALVADGYRVEAFRALDMFPHTPHVECVAALRRDAR